MEANFIILVATTKHFKFVFMYFKDYSLGLIYWSIYWINFEYLWPSIHPRPSVLSFRWCISLHTGWLHENFRLAGDFTSPPLEEGETNSGYSFSPVKKIIMINSKFNYNIIYLHFGQSGLHISIQEPWSFMLDKAFRLKMCRTNRTIFYWRLWYWYHFWILLSLGILIQS